MDEISALRELRPSPDPAELEARRAATRQKFMTGTRAAGPGRPGRPASRSPVPALAGGLTAAAAGIAVTALILSGGPTAAAGRAKTVVTAAWTVREDANGSVTVYLRQYANPAGLQRTLRTDGVNAIVRRIPSELTTIPRATLLPSGQQAPPGRRPACSYGAANNAPPAVQSAVITRTSLSQGSLPAGFVIHPRAMPAGSALFLTFLDGVPVSVKNAGTGVRALPPVVLNNNAVPACVAIPKSMPPPGPGGPPRSGQ